MSKSVVIVDDHILIAEALEEIIEQFRGFSILYTAENGKQLVEKFKQPKNIPDLVLLDINMPVMDGFETAAWIKKNRPEVMIMALSMQDEEEALIKMVRSGASGYLLKNIHRFELEAALNAIFEKGYYYPDWATHKMLRTLAGTEQSIPIIFTERELEFFKYAATELTYKEISDRMFCSPRTVESYRDSIFEKLGIRTRVGIVLYGLKHKLIMLDK